MWHRCNQNESAVALFHFLSAVNRGHAEDNPSATGAAAEP
jgi:hypothetical protein